MALRRGTAGVALLATLLLGLLVVPPPAASQELEQPASPKRPPAGYELSARDVLEVARGTTEVAEERREAPRLEATAYTNGPGRWQVSFVADDDEVAQVHVDDASGRVLEAWAGPQVAWKMARGYEGAFGGTLNAPYVWLPLCLVFLIPFVDPRRPFRLLHLDLLVLLGFGASHVFFNRGDISWSVPLVYPVLAYLLARMLWIGFRPRERRQRLVPLVPVTALALAVVFLVGFRVALNVADSRVIDVGYAGVIGADVIADGDGLYDGSFPEENGSGDTYGPVNYLAYLPFEQVFSWSGEWDDLPAAHGAAIAFDILTIVGLFLLGRRLRDGPEGRMLGVALAFAWASYPYTTYVLASNANDSLVAMLVVYALLALTSAPARGLLLGLAAASKFAPLALAPLFARGVDRGADGWSRREVSPASAGSNGHAAPATGRSARRAPDVLRRLGGPALFTLAFGATIAAAALIFMPDGGLRELYDRTVGYQAGRDSPFSVWGQVPSLDWLQTATKVAAVALAAAVAFVPRRRRPGAGGRARRGGPDRPSALGVALVLPLRRLVRAARLRGPVRAPPPPNPRSLRPAARGPGASARGVGGRRVSGGRGAKRVSPGRAARRPALVAVAVLALTFGATLVLHPWSDESVGDLGVRSGYAELLLEGTMPYRDFLFEYPPLAAPAIAVPGLLGTDDDAYRLGIAAFTFLLTAVVVLLAGALAAAHGRQRHRGHGHGGGQPAPSRSGGATALRPARGGAHARGAGGPAGP